MNTKTRRCRGGGDEMRMVLVGTDTANRVVQPILFQEMSCWVGRVLGLETNQAVVSRIASTHSCSLALVSVLVAAESLRGVELSRAV